MPISTDHDVGGVPGSLMNDVIYRRALRDMIISAVPSKQRFEVHLLEIVDQVPRNPIALNISL